LAESQDLSGICSAAFLGVWALGSRVEDHEHESAAAAAAAVAYDDDSRTDVEVDVDVDGVDRVQHGG